MELQRNDYSANMVHDGSVGLELKDVAAWLPDVGGEWDDSRSLLVSVEFVSVKSQSVTDLRKYVVMGRSEAKKTHQGVELFNACVANLCDGPTKIVTAVMQGKPRVTIRSKEDLRLQGQLGWKTETLSIGASDKYASEYEYGVRLNSDKEVAFAYKMDTAKKVLNGTGSCGVVTYESPKEPHRVDNHLVEGAERDRGRERVLLPGPTPLATANKRATP